MSFPRALTMLMLLAGSWVCTVAAEKSAEAKVGEPNPAFEARFQEWKSSRPRAEQAWISTLEANLGAYYLPLFKQDKLSNRTSAWDFVQDDPALPRVLLIGDSISRGYTLTVRTGLAGKANVHRAPENCGGTAKALEKLDIWLANGPWKVIHFNFGIHDRGTKDEVYATNLQQVVDRLRTTGATLIWATTTAVPDNHNKEGFSPVRCETLNRIASTVMARNGIISDDLFSLIQPRLGELQLPNDVHFTAQGYQALGDQVARHVLAQLTAGQ